MNTLLLSGCGVPMERIPVSPPPSPVSTPDADVTRALTGRAGTTPYLTWDRLTATVEDYVSAVREVGNALQFACWQRDIPFQEYPDSEKVSGLFGDLIEGGRLVSGDPVYAWDNTVDGVPFDSYLEQRAQVLAFYRVWRESSLAPAPAEAEFQVWAEEQAATRGYLRVAFIPVADSETARMVRDALVQDEGRLEELWESCSLTPETDMIFTGTPDLFIPELVPTLAAAHGQWAAMDYVPGWDPEQTRCAVVKELPLTIEDYRDLLIKEAWPTAIDPDKITLADGAEELNAARLYEDWYAWSMTTEGTVSLSFTEWAQIPDEVPITQARGENAPSKSVGKAVDP